MNSQDSFSLGIFIGIMLTAAVWLGCCDITESSKTRNGYLTHKEKIYSVKLVRDMGEERAKTIATIMNDKEN